MIEITRTRNHLVEGWSIINTNPPARCVGMIVRTELTTYVVVRRHKNGALGIAARKPSFAEAKQFVLNGGDHV